MKIKSPIKKLYQSILCSLSILTFPAMANEVNKPSNIFVHIEQYKMSASTYSEIMGQQNLNLKDLRDSLSEQAKADPNKLLFTHTLIGRSGEQIENQVIVEHIYPTEYEPAEIANKPNPETDPTPPTPTAFETRNIGSITQVEAVMGEKREFIDLQIEIEHTQRLEDHVFAKWKTKHAETQVIMPKIASSLFKSAITVKNGSFSYLGTSSPNINGKPDHTNKILIFVKAEIIDVK